MDHVKNFSFGAVMFGGVILYCGVGLFGPIVFWSHVGGFSWWALVCTLATQGFFFGGLFGLARGFK